MSMPKNCSSCGRFLAYLFPFGYMCKNPECPRVAMVVDDKGNLTGVVNETYVPKDHPLGGLYYSTIKDKKKISMLIL